MNVDRRGTAEVSAKRSIVNGTPYRSPARKAQAKEQAVRDRDGSWHCDTVPVNFHKGAER